MYMDLVIKDLHQNYQDTDFVQVYADDIAQMATSTEKTTRWNKSFKSYNPEPNSMKLQILHVWVCN